MKVSELISELTALVASGAVSPDFEVRVWAEDTGNRDKGEATLDKEDGDDPILWVCPVADGR